MRVVKYCRPVSRRWDSTISTKRTIVRNTAANFIAQFAQMASSFIFMPFLIGRFGLDDYGIFLLAGSLTGYLGLLDLGVGSSLVKYIAEYRAKGDDRSVSETVSTAFVFYGIIGVVAAVLMSLVAFFGIGWFKLPEASEVLARNLFLVGAGSALLTWPLSTSNFILAGTQRYDLAARVSIAVTLANVLVTAAVIFLEQGPLVLLIGINATSIALALWSLNMAFRELGGTHVRLGDASWRRMKMIFRFSAAIFVTQLASVLVYQQTDRVVLGVFVGASSIALYEAAQKLHSFVRQYAGLSASAVLPTASQLHAEERHEALLSLFMRGTKYTVIAVTPVVLAVMALAEPILRDWLGEDFVVMTFGAQLYLSYWLLNANITVAGGMLIGLGKTKFPLYYSIVASLVNVVVSIALARVIGVNGVIMGTIVHAYFGFPIYMWYVSRIIGFRLRDWWRLVVLPTYPFLLVTAGVTIGANVFGMTSNLIATGIVAVLSIGLYWLAIYRFGLTDAERGEANAGLRAVKSKLGLSS